MTTMATVLHTPEPTPLRRFPWSVEDTQAYLNERTPLEPVRGRPGSKLLVRALSRFINWLSWEQTDRFGAFVGRLMYRLRVRRRVALTNLDIVYGATKTRAEKLRIVRASLENLGRLVVINYFRPPSMDAQFWRDVVIENRAALDAAYNRGRGVVLIGGHIGMWEMVGSAIGMAGYPMSLIAKKLPNPVFDYQVKAARLATNLGTISHRESMSRIFDGLRRGEGIAVAVDQNMKRSQGVFVDWLGRLASTVRSAAWVVRESGAAVVFGYAVRVAPGRFKIVISDEIKWEPHPEPEQELLINTRRMLLPAEEIILKDPTQWHWVHRRWKVQPEGVPNPYE
jgi:KDO2-lipid IV(A) lauroyltransferase